MLQVKPFCGMVLEQLECRVGESADEALHAEMKRRVVVLDLHKEVLDGDFCVELFVNLAHDCLLGGFSLFDLAAGEFPAAFEFSIASLRC